MISIYTKTGDRGETGYLGGRISKAHPLIALLGDLDELNALVGSIADFDDTSLVRIQKQLFSISALAADWEDKLKLNYPIKDWIDQLEKEIDSWQGELPELKNFILPGGPAAELHLARAICRRVERSLVKVLELQDSEKLQAILPYINRLSDWLFVFARKTNTAAGYTEVIWS